MPAFIFNLVDNLLTTVNRVDSPIDVGPSSLLKSHIGCSRWFHHLPLLWCCCSHIGSISWIFWTSCSLVNCQYDGVYWYVPRYHHNIPIKIVGYVDVCMYVYIYIHVNPKYSIISPLTIFPVLTIINGHWKQSPFTIQNPQSGAKSQV